MFIVDPMYCEWDTTSVFLLFSDNVFGNYIYYSHLLPIVASVLLIAVLLWQDYKNVTTKSLLFMTLMFAAWSLSDLILWATANPAHTMFFWSIILHFEVLVYIGSLYFIYYFVSKHGLKWKYELLLLIAYLPLILFAHTSLNLTGFDYTNCYREAQEGPLVTYAYTLELLIAIWILGYGLVQAHKLKSKNRAMEIILATVGTALFLISFSFGNIIGTLEIDWELGQYGLFSLPLFIGLLTYLTIRYNSFNAKLYSAQALILGIFVLVVSMMFIKTIQNVRVIVIATSLLILFLGYLLIKSVRKEIEQRKQIEKLAEDLKKANSRLKTLDRMKSEFVSIASHQLRSPLTSIRGYTSMLLEGSYGKLSKKVLNTIERIADSSRFMALSIEDYLNVSRIEAGNMKYEMADFNLKEVAKKIVDEMRPAAIKEGLLMVFKSDCDSSAMVNADVGKTRQVIMNLIDNSIKYTKKGTLTIFAHDDVKKKKMYVTVHDTGVGIDPNALDDVFEKFVREKDANQVNTTGTGLGLYVAKKIIESMKGRIWAESEGKGKGSSFHIELPLISKK